MSTDRLADLILLAEKGMGWKRIEWNVRDMLSGEFCVDEKREAIYLWNPVDELWCWDPWTNLRHAGMLMRALKIHLSVNDDGDGNFWGWYAHTSAYPKVDANYSAVQDDNTESAQCATICECALKIIKARSTHDHTH